MEEIKLKAQFLYNDVCDLWRGFCELHNELYELACEEHLLLMQSDIENLDDCLARKEKIISKVTQMEGQRATFIEFLNKDYSKKTIVKARDLIDFFKSHVKDDLLEQYNVLLIDIIENIQEQNKRNRIFLNKALYSLNQIKKDFSGSPYIETYNASGEKQMEMKK